MKKSTVAIAVASAMGASATASAAEWNLTTLYTWSGANGAAAYLYGQTGFSSDPANNLSQNAGTLNSYSYAGVTWLTTEKLTNWNIAATGGSTGTYSCVEGAFGGVVGANICGNYNFGANKTQESSIDNVGGRTVGGDDIALGPAQSLTGNYSGLAPFFGYTGIAGSFGTDWLAFTTRSVTGTGNGTGNAGSGLGNGLSGDGVLLVFEAVAVPVPAAVWLFGSALGLLGWARRKAS